MKSKIYKKSAKGFTLIELMVAVAIILIITSVALFNQAKFSSDILISNMAYEIALTIRQAQVYGISSKGNDAGSPSENYRVGYGVHFEAASGVKPNQFISFVDMPLPTLSDQGDTQFNFMYNVDNSSGPTDILASTVELTQGQKIRRFCGHEKGAASGNWTCWGVAAPDSQNMSLDIVFVKPDPDAHITIAGNSNYDQAKIIIESGLGDKCRTVRVYTSGQVEVDPIQANDTTAGCELSN